ncbi:MAG: hypothetical protein U0790_03285 [Isosphaeraceae bacterium]
MTFDFNRRIDDAITIRPAQSVEDYRACQEAQRRAWGITEPGYVVPIATMVGANLHGGLVLGAFLDDGRAAAMSFAFLGRVEERLCLYSQLTGVTPDWQGRGLGHELKTAQREFARRSSIPLIAWAFDPLQAGNAHFNLERLGARVRRYIDNMYGERTDALNAGVPTDRVIAEWDVAAEEGGPAEPRWPGFPPRMPGLIRVAEGRSGTPIPAGVDEHRRAAAVFVEVPAGIARLRQHDSEAAESWRLAVRRALRDCFAAGYVAVGFSRGKIDDVDRCGYVLVRGEAPGVANGPSPV